jgi:hypothetical protein
LIIGETTCVLGCVCAERVARMERLLDATPSPPPTPTAPEKDGAKPGTKRELTTALGGEREAMHLAMPPHLGTPAVAAIDPLDRYEQRALSRRNRAVQKFLEMIARSSCRWSAQDGPHACPALGCKLRLR